jgi:two-component system, OmpR family, sensor kinase
VRLSSRVSAFFLAALAVVLAGFSAGIYVTASRYLRHQVDERLASSLAVLVAAVEIHNDSVEWEPQEREVLLGQEDGPNGLRWTVHDDRGQRIGHSPNLDDSSLTAAWTPDPSDLDPPRQLEDRDGLAWRLARRRVGPNAVSGLTTKAEPDESGTVHKALMLTVAAPLAPVERTLTSLVGMLAGLALGVWVVAAVLGRWLVGRALAPLRRMVESARGLDAADAGWSLPTTATGDELDELGRAFNELLERLHVAFERQRRFASDASHQLRTPLTALIGQIDVALRRDRPDDEYRRVLGTIRAQAGGLGQIVEALLFLGRADSEAGLPDVHVLDLADWLPAYVQGHAIREQIDLEAAGMLRVRAHSALLGQLMDNLIDNAAKYGEPDATIIVRATADGGSVALAVEDCGPGIDPADLPRVFEPFFRSTRARRLGRPGVGLGLAVAQRIASAFGGTMSVENIDGHGCRFVLRLPGVEQLTLNTEESPASVMPDGSEMIKT